MRHWSIACALIATSLLLTGTARADGAGDDEVTLVNGGSVRGTVVVSEPGKSVEILVEGAKTPRVIPWSEVSGVEKGKYATTTTTKGAEAEVGDSSPDAVAAVRITSDWPETEVVQHLGTSYGEGNVGGYTASVTTVHLQKLCRTPCSTSLATEGDYYVDAPGMHPRGFRLPAGSKSLDVRVEGASSTPLALSYTAFGLGAASAVTGGILWGVFESSNDGGEFDTDTTTWRTMTFIGAGVMVAGIVGLVFFPKTHVETDEGVLLDASASGSPSQGIRFKGNGFVF